MGPHEFADGIVSNIFLLTFAVAQIGFFALILTAILRLLAVIIPNRAFIKTISILVSSLAICAIFTDTFIYQQYRFHFNSIILELMIEGGTEIFSLSWMMWFKMVSITAAFFAAQIIISEYIWRKQSAKAFSLKPVLLTWLGLFILSNGIHTWADAMFKRDITQQARYFPLSYPLTAKSFMAKFGLLNIEAQKQQALLKQRKVKTDLNYPIEAMQCEAPEKPLNIVMIAIDSWRNDTMNAQITPAIYDIATRGINFTNHHSGSNNTRHGMFTLFYGIPGHYWPNMLDLQRGPVMIDELNNQDYQMGIFASAKLTSPEFDQTIFRKVKNLRTHSKGSEPYERDIDITKDFITWQQNLNNDKPFFSFMLFDAAHGFSLPSDYPLVFKPSLREADYLALDDDYDAEPFLNLYKNSIHFIDTQIKHVLDQLADKMDNTVIIITGDHGKEFNDSKKGFWGHNSNYSSYQTHVPMIVYWPEKNTKIVNQISSHYDIAPTILSDALGCSNNTSQYSSGQSLFDPLSDRWLLLGRNGYFAIKTKEQISELDRYGNFTIFDNNYQKVPNAKLNMKVTLQAMDELKRFYKKKK